MFSQTLSIDIEKRSTLSPSTSRSTAFRFSIQLVAMEAALPKIFDSLFKICVKSQMMFTALAVFHRFERQFWMCRRVYFEKLFCFPYLEQTHDNFGLSPEAAPLAGVEKFSVLLACFCENKARHYVWLSRRLDKIQAHRFGWVPHITEAFATFRWIDLSEGGSFHLQLKLSVHYQLS